MKWIVLAVVLVGCGNTQRQEIERLEAQIRAHENARVSAVVKKREAIEKDPAYVACPKGDEPDWGDDKRCPGLIAEVEGLKAQEMNLKIETLKARRDRAVSAECGGRAPKW